ncbi:MAG: hypothetical protein A2X08_06670 [Bacteroidetes bacterium GWA2_32_17]|nr:MAG: hypothetical protein A2X08_06670 [Bacteroidetes bacterium GWA2_32_17]
MVSCRKTENNCLWAIETSGIDARIGGYYNHTSNSFPYDSLQIHLEFTTKYLPHDKCNEPYDSILGKIKEIYVITKNLYNANYNSNDTINNIIKIRYYNSITNSLTSDFTPLNNFIQNNPNSTYYIQMFLSEPPSEISSQSFIITYKEDNGKIYIDSTDTMIISY